MAVSVVDIMLFTFEGVPFDLLRERTGSTTSSEKIIVSGASAGAGRSKVDGPRSASWLKNPCDP